MKERSFIGSLGILLISAIGSAEAGLILGLALLITVAIFMGGTVLYTSGKIQVTTRFRRIMYVLLIGVILTSLIIGIVSIFTYGMQKGLDRLAAANVKNVSLTNFDVIAKVAAEEKYIKDEDIARLIAFRNNPSDESWIGGK